MGDRQPGTTAGSGGTRVRGYLVERAQQRSEARAVPAAAVAVSTVARIQMINLLSLVPERVVTMLIQVPYRYCIPLIPNCKGTQP